MTVFLRLIFMKNIITHLLKYMYSKEIVLILNPNIKSLISFRCLHPTGGVLPFATKKCMKTAVACFKLHNKCFKDRLPMPGVDFDIQTQGEEEINNLQANSASVAQQIGKRLVQCF